MEEKYNKSVLTANNNKDIPTSQENAKDSQNYFLAPDSEDAYKRRSEKKQDEDYLTNPGVTINSKLIKDYSTADTDAPPSQQEYIQKIIDMQPNSSDFSNISYDLLAQSDLPISLLQIVSEISTLPVQEAFVQEAYHFGPSDTHGGISQPIANGDK